MATREEARELMKKGYGLVMRNAAASYVTPVYWGPPPSRAPRPHINHGTIFFIQCGGPILGITADHVYAAYLERKKQEPRLISQIGNLRIDLEQRLIDRNSDLDIATFGIQENELRAIDKIAHIHPERSWPPAPPAVGKGVFFCGFPFSGRSFRDPRSMDFELAFWGLVADRVDDSLITCQFSREEWVDVYGNDSLGTKEDMGGVSGSPLWALIDSRGVYGWRLAGIVIQFNDAFELLYARRPDGISPNGKIGS